MSVVVKWLASRSLRAKLLWTNIATVALSLATVIAIVAASEWHHAKKSLVDDAYTQARVLGSAASATLVFDDPLAAREVLGTLQLSPNIREAAVFRSNRTELARYRRPGRDALPALGFPAQPDGHVFGASVLEVSQPILFDQVVVGYIVLRASLDVAWERLRWTAIASAIAVAVALAVASLLAWRLRDVVVGPILRLAQVARDISEVGDYGRRAEIEGRDEVGILARDFNCMIEQIERINADLEKRVQERTAELVAVNRELESFTYATSHDLRGPLGRINSFSAMLEQKYADRLEGEGLLFLGFIRQNSIRLNQLVSDLLSHARMTKQAVVLEPVNLSALVQAVLRQKAEDIRESGASIEFDVPPVEVQGDPCALMQVVDNIVGNALKYSSSVRSPRVAIGGRVAGNRFLLWVRDNGIGFDMAYHDRIFEIFHRLHTYQEYEGSGVGLALVKRAMERMGGRVWAESEPGRGATFSLELPRAEASEDEVRPIRSAGKTSELIAA